MHDDTIDTHAQQVTQAIVSAAEACIPQSKPAVKWNMPLYRIGITTVKTQSTKEIVLEINLTTKSRRKMLKTTKY